MRDTIGCLPTVALIFSSIRLLLLAVGFSISRSSVSRLSRTEGSLPSDSAGMYSMPVGAPTALLFAYFWNDAFVNTLSPPSLPWAGFFAVGALAGVVDIPGRVGGFGGVGRSVRAKERGSAGFGPVWGRATFVPSHPFLISGILPLTPLSFGGSIFFGGMFGSVLISGKIRFSMSRRSCLTGRNMEALMSLAILAASSISTPNSTSIFLMNSMVLAMPIITSVVSLNNFFSCSPERL